MDILLCIQEFDEECDYIMESFMNYVDEVGGGGKKKRRS